MKKIMSFKELDTLAEKLSDYAEENTTIALIGDLGTGKTTFTKLLLKIRCRRKPESPTLTMYLNISVEDFLYYHF